MKSLKQFAIENTRKNGFRMRTLKPQGAKYKPIEHFQWREQSDFLADALKGVPYTTYTTDNTEVMESLITNGYKDKSGAIWWPFFAFWKDQEGHAFMVPKDSGIKDLRDVGIETIMKTPADFMKVGKYVNRLFAALAKDDPTVFVDEASGKIDVEIPGMGVWGSEIEGTWNEKDQSCLVLIDEEGRKDLSEEERTIAIRYVDLKTLDPQSKAIADGMNPISEKFCRLMGLDRQPRIGQAWRATAGTQRGLAKGHFPYHPELSVDLVIYGPKTIVRTNRFFFGSIGPLHAGRPHTDMQAYVNFGFHRPGLAMDLAKAYMREVIAASKNEADMRRLLLAHVKNVTEADRDMQIEAWVLRRALQYGISYLRFPGLYRRVIRYLTEKVMACEERARIPMDSVTYSVAKYGYVLGDYINAIDDEGLIHPENAIPEGTIVFPDLPAGTKVVVYRQPSENTNAWVPLTVTYRPEYKRLAGRGICLLGRGADKVLGRLGGGDMDDQFVIVHDPKWVEAFHTLRPYPETQKLSAEITEADTEMFAEEPEDIVRSLAEELEAELKSKDYTHYTNRHVSYQIDKANNARAGIGPVVNFGMMDTLLSDPDQSNSMMADLATPAAREWLEEYRTWKYPDKDMLPGTTPLGYHARKFMTNLEIVIDGNVKDRTLLAKLGDVSGAIKRFHADCMVYPACMAPQRIPPSKVEKGEYVTARSLTCRSLETIRNLRKTLNDFFVEREWLLVSPAQDTLRYSYPFEKEIHRRVRGVWKNVGTADQPEWEEQAGKERSLLGLWGQEWNDRFTQARMLREAGQERAAKLLLDNAYSEIITMVAEAVEDADDEMMEKLAVELYFNTYKRWDNTPKVDDNTGAYRNFTDALLWSPVFANPFIDALRKAFTDETETHRIAGYYKVAEIRPELRRQLIDSTGKEDKTHEMVEVRNHQVYIRDSNDEYTVWVGWVTGWARDGVYRMDAGVIEFRKGHAMIQPRALTEGETAIMQLAQKPVTRLYPSVKQPEEVKPAGKEPSTALGRLINKALTQIGIKREEEDKK